MNEDKLDQLARVLEQERQRDAELRQSMARLEGQVELLRRQLNDLRSEMSGLTRNMAQPEYKPYKEVK